MLYERQKLESELHALMLRSLAGEKSAYELFLQRVARMAKGYLLNTLPRALRNEDSAEDLVQEVLISIHRKRHLYNPQRPVLPWLFAVARYRMIDHLRALKRRPAFDELSSEMEAVVPGSDVLPEDQVFNVEELLTVLQGPQKEIFVMAKAEGIPLNEIARRMNMSLSAVKVHVHRAVKKLRLATQEKNNPACNQWTVLSVNTDEEPT